MASQAPDGSMAAEGQPGGIRLPAPGRTLRIYLAGPMRGVPEFNHPAFRDGARRLREAGHVVFSPAEHDQFNGFDWTGHSGDLSAAEAAGFSLRVALGADLAWITANADAVVVLPRWEKSAGVRAEAATAIALGLPVYEIGPFLAVGRAARPLAADAFADRAGTELARLQKLLIAARQYRVLPDEDGDLQLLGPCAETIGCLFHRCFTSEDGASLGALIDEALEHEEQGKRAHAHLARIGAEEGPDHG